jgi:hypothetical protein
MIGGTILLGLVSFAITQSSSPAVTVIVAFGVGGLSLLFVRLINSHITPELGELTAMLMGGLAVGLGWLLKWLTAKVPGRADAVGMLAALGAAWLFELVWQSGSVPKCFACGEPIDRPPSFVCPRCKLPAHAKPECWNARYFRCSKCDGQGINIFPIDKRGWSANEAWWSDRVGPRVHTGDCGGPCMRDARAADLRECGHCNLPMCTRCWDYYNGQCQRCGWIMPDLTAELAPFLLPTGPVGRRRA